MSMRRESAFTLAGLLLVALAARLPMLIVGPGVQFDMESYRLVAKEMLAGAPLYSDPLLKVRYPYLPPWALVVVSMEWLSRASGLAESFCLRLPALLGDLGVVALLFRILRGREAEQGCALPALERRSTWASLAYAASPLAIIISAGHGQFDSLPLLCLLLAYAAMQKSAGRRAALWLGAGIALKTWPLVLLPLFLKPLPQARSRLRFTAWALLPPLLVTLPWLFSTPGELAARVLSYTGVRCIGLNEAVHALSYLLGWPSWVMRAMHQGLSLLLAAAWLTLSALYLWGPWRLALEEGLALAVLLLYVLAPGISTQYLLWLLPLALLLPGSLALRHQFYSLPVLLLFYTLFMPEAFLDGRFKGQLAPSAGMLLPWIALNLGLWLFFLLEAARLLRRAARPPAGGLTPVL
jgi:hypothetical protein